VVRKAHAQEKAARDGSFQLGGRARCDDAPVVDDREVPAQCVGLFHVVSGEQDGAAFLVVLADNFPQQEPRLWIQACARFVEKQDRRVVHHGARDRNALHHAAGKAADELVGAIRQLEAIEQDAGALGAFVRTEAEIGSVEEENLARGEREIQVRALRHDSDLTLGSRLVAPDVISADPCSAAGWANASGQNTDGGRLSRPIGAEEPKMWPGATSRNPYARVYTSGAEYRKVPLDPPAVRPFVPFAPRRRLVVIVTIM
jgi:hypothetical protein